MDFQNVKELTIDEGDVKTIHDSDGNILWGALGYEVDYQGDTTQDDGATPDNPQTVNVVTGTQGIWVHGKNIFTFGTSSATRQGITWVCSGDTATGSGTATQTWTDVTPKIALPTPLPIGDYTFSIPSALSKKVDAYFWHLDNTRSSISLSAGQTSKTVTIAKETVNVSIALGYITVNETIDLELSNFQIESGSTVTTYEPYQGSTYTINLGSIELCKIDTYQDYIYKSGDNWYVHKETAKSVFDGTESWTGINSYAYFITEVSEDIIRPDDIYGTPLILSPQFEATTRSKMYNSVVDYGIGIHEATPSRVIIRNKDYTTTPTFTTWLSNNNVICYYALASSSDTQITNITLIDQLDAVYDWAIRYGYNFTVSGNLPLVISQTLIT